MTTKKAPAAPTVQSTARGIERCGSCGLLAERGRSLEADEEQDPEQDAAEHAAAGDPEPRRLARVEHRERDAVLAALGDDHEREDQHRDERDDARR